MKEIKKKICPTKKLEGVKDPIKGLAGKRDIIVRVSLRDPKTILTSIDVGDDITPLDTFAAIPIIADIIQKQIKRNNMFNELHNILNN